MDLISVIINVYNGEKYIGKCLDSIVGQTYKNLEIIIVNDGSTDKTLEICKSYNDSRIKIINQKNIGLSLSRNVGIEASSGEYLYFVDADDFIKLDTIEYLYNLCRNNDCVMATCSTLDIYNYNFKEVPKEDLFKVISGIDFLKKILLSIDRSGTIWNKLFKKELFYNIRFEDRIINDIVVLYKLAFKIDRCVCSNQIKYYYLKNEDSITGKHSFKRAIDEYDASLERYLYIKDILPNLDENDICMLHSIVLVYNHADDTVDKYLEEKNAKKLFDSLFNLKKILKSSLARKQKIKIILYRINPKLERKIQLLYKRKK